MTRTWWLAKVKTSSGWWRGAVGGVVVVAQLAMVLLSQLGSSCCEARYFAWAPNDYSVAYSITVLVNGRKLSADAITRRYQLASSGFWEDPPQRLEHLFSRRDQLYAKGERVQLVLHYRLDGHRELIWTWHHG